MQLCYTPYLPYFRYISGTEFYLYPPKSVKFGTFFWKNVGLFDAFIENYTMLSIEEHAQAMWENKHLPKVVGKDDLGDKPSQSTETTHS